MTIVKVTTLRECTNAEVLGIVSDQNIVANKLLKLILEATAHL